MKIAVTGSRGLIGSALVPLLTAQGHDVIPIRRDAGGEFGLEALRGADAVIHLAGESIAGRWTGAKKNRIIESRVRGTTAVVRAICALDEPPGVFLCASAIGFYGNRGDAVLTEDDGGGSGFLVEVCRRWEEAAREGLPWKVRSVSLRFGVVLSPEGGALPSMLLPVRFFLAGPVGSGDQFMSWISIDDAVGLILHALCNESVRGPLNVVAPDPVTNREFTRTLCRVQRRPMNFALPMPIVRLLFGEMADALLLSSLRVVPRKAEMTGYVYERPHLEEALRRLLAKSR